MHKKQQALIDEIAKIRDDYTVDMNNAINVFLHKVRRIHNACALGAFSDCDDKEIVQTLERWNSVVNAFSRMERGLKYVELSSIRRHRSRTWTDILADYRYVTDTLTGLLGTEIAFADHEICMLSS